MKTFSNLSQFKKLIVIGQKMDCIFHKFFAGRDEQGKPVWESQNIETREVSRVQTNSFALKTQKKDGKIVDSWCQYPKASEVKIIDNNKLVIFENDGKPVLTYSFPD